MTFPSNVLTTGNGHLQSLEVSNFGCIDEHLQSVGAVQVRVITGGSRRSTKGGIRYAIHHAFL